MLATAPAGVAAQADATVELRLQAPAGVTLIEERAPGLVARAGGERSVTCHVLPSACVKSR